MTRSTDNKKVIKVHDSDNVAIVIGQGGVAAGTQLQAGLVAIVDIPQGHKIALSDIPSGAEVIRYNEVIGTATETIPLGGHVNERNIALRQPPSLQELEVATREYGPAEPLAEYTFQGYRNADGSVGTRNVLGITTSVQCVAGTVEHAVKRIKAELLPKYPNVDDVVGLTHTYGCGVAINAPAAIIPIRTLKNITLNPNFGGEVMVVGLGCEKLQPSTLVSEQPVKIYGANEKADSSGHILSLQDERFVGFSEMMAGIMAMAEQHLAKLDQRRRESCPVSELVVGTQCGGSDAFSGVTANPAVGFAADLIVRAGGTVMFSEVTEVRDAIHLLAPRVIDAEVGEKLIREMAWYDEYLAQGQADRSANPSPGNKSGGLSNVIEKALGSIAKSGTSPIIDVLGPGERIRKRGLNFVATPASDFICGTLQLAAGMNMHVFTTGRGTPYGLSMVPVIKVGTNTTLSRRWHDLIDLDAGRIASGDDTIEAMGWELFHLILDIASGREQAAVERLGIHNDLALFNPAPVT
ncbi:galactarate dehydratase [Modicisalibacter luteus]|uniref:Galactarate dehydratase n=1 Tax=Modicisalibacter luteus TaxID=453962 RepID=A0ABV7M3R6_9GAMM|nr:galactarate dehydratase [Halomonas lutea]GHA87529.1 putative galactarate dehydratase (L-threo-forming) [Halomonas lutea]